MTQYKHVSTDEIVEAELLGEDQGVIDVGDPEYDENVGRTVTYAEGNYVLVYEDGTIKTMHPSIFEIEFEEVV